MTSTPDAGGDQPTVIAGDEVVPTGDEPALTAEVLSAAELERTFTIPFTCLETQAGAFVLPKGL